MDDLIDFKCVRIQSELDRYQRSKVIPHDLLEGAFDIDDIQQCMHHFTKKHQRIAKRLIEQYTVNINSNLESCKAALRKDYAATIATLATGSSEFMFPTVLHPYRSDINPVTALYYETRELMRSFNPESQRHEWLFGVVTDKEFNNKIISALSKDIKRLERIIQRYYLPLNKLNSNIPLELFHARQLTKDFKHYMTLFDSVRHWDPAEQ